MHFTENCFMYLKVVFKYQCVCMAFYDFVLHQIILITNTQIASTLHISLWLFNSQMQWHLFSLFPFDLKHI